MRNVGQPDAYENENGKRFHPASVPKGASRAGYPSSAGLGEELPYFAFLLVTAVALYYAKWPVLFIAAAVIVFQGWLWLCRRHSIFYLGTDPFRRVASAAVK